MSSLSTYTIVLYKEMTQFIHVLLDCERSQITGGRRGARLVTGVKRGTLRGAQAGDGGERLSAAGRGDMRGWGGTCSSASTPLVTAGFRSPGVCVCGKTGGVSVGVGGCDMARVHEYVRASACARARARACVRSSVHRRARAATKRLRGSEKSGAGAPRIRCGSLAIGRASLTCAALYAIKERRGAAAGPPFWS